MLEEGDREDMTKQEASQRYSIPTRLLDEYESWGLCREAQYNDRDLERLSMMMTLYDVGFTGGEVEAYMRLLLEGAHTKDQRMRILNGRREHALEEIHAREAQLARLDYLRHNTDNANIGNF